ncbi:Hypothetical predicted protein [Mytilus galloprovincialis]|uniref:BEN domain-containing protein n=1 Tax=Mytilus galloprovincialis TaxID=29158 RepID=A0A8B6DH37_MYTGA|nr:Hypothetical predicted protein [Mytilus galloprovincialis]
MPGPLELVNIMFACIYFEEDKSISVVGKENKELKVDGEFESKSKCTMQWKVRGTREMKTYHGTIIKTNSNKDQLTGFGNAAVKEIVNKNPEKSYEETIQCLLDYGSNYSNKASTKRERKVTVIMKESVEQTENLSPRKKKKEMEKKTEKKETEKKNVNKAERNGKSNATDKNKVSENSSILEYHKSDLGFQFEDRATVVEESEIDLSTTGQKVLEASNIIQNKDVEMDFTMSRPNRIPGTTDSEVHQRHQCYENVPLTYHELKAPSDINKNEDLTSNNHGNSGSSKVTDLDMNTCDTLERFEENENVLDALQSISEFVNETSEAVAAHSNSMSDQIVSTTNISTSKTSQISHSVSERRTSPRKTPTKMMMTTTPLVKQSTVPVTTLKSSSPHCSPFNKESSEAVKCVKLLENHDHMVKAEELRRITARAKKEKIPGYYVVIKLMPLLFTTEEMANSRGQGIKPAKQGDTRPPLDINKIQTIKAYSEAYCKKHHLKPATESGMNDAVTEAIAYSRKKIKKQMQIETPTK